MKEQWRELKETITELRDNDGTGTQQEVCKFLVNLMDTLEKQMSSSEKLNKWIPVSEKLPERDVNVLAYVIGVGIEYQRVMWIDDCTGEWVGFVGSGYKDRVIAWMPLPEPYDPKERSDKE